jgi:uncharacterized protein (DUF362 family)
MVESTIQVASYCVDKVLDHTCIKTHHQVPYFEYVAKILSRAAAQFKGYVHIKKSIMEYRYVVIEAQNGGPNRLNQG